MLQSLSPSQRKQFMPSTQSHDLCQNTCEIHGKPALLQSTFSASTLIENHNGHTLHDFSSIHLKQAAT
ncbi:hypothetical protein NC652_013354 [Populus alba x Populus x berolinensis]|nr:hypothetical protein NC652_013354 [Populus alba x Populus x berolinensis]